MKDHQDHNLSADDWDEKYFPRTARQDFDDGVDRAISRRGFLGGVLAFGSGAAVMGTGTPLDLARFRLQRKERRGTDRHPAARTRS